MEKVLAWREQLPDLVRNVTEFKFEPESDCSQTPNPKPLE